MSDEELINYLKFKSDNGLTLEDVIDELEYRNYRTNQGKSISDKRLSGLSGEV